MIARRLFTRALLALTLLFSQQMAVTHALSHWRGAQPSVQHGSAKSLAADQSCAQCLAFAQIGSALGSDTLSFAAVDTVSPAVTTVPRSAEAGRTVLAFRSRGPPVQA